MISRIGALLMLACLLAGVAILRPAILASDSESTLSEPSQTERPLWQSDEMEATLIPNQYIVVFDEANLPQTSDGQELSSQAMADAVVMRFGGEVHHTYDTAIKGFAATLSPEAVNELRSDRSVAFVEQDAVFSIYDKPSVPWGLDRIDQRELPLDNQYIYESTGNGVHAYIIRYGHPQFAQ